MHTFDTASVWPLHINLSYINEKKNSLSVENIITKIAVKFFGATYEATLKFEKWPDATDNLTKLLNFCALSRKNTKKMQ